MCRIKLASLVYFDVGGRVVLEFGWWLPIFGRLDQVVRHTPVQFGPSFECDDFSGSRLRQALEANVGGESHGHTARAQQEADLLRAGVSPRQWHFDGDGHDARFQATVKSADEADGVAVGEDERHTIARLDAAQLRHAADSAAAAVLVQLVQQRVGDLVRAALQLACNTNTNKQRQFVISKTISKRKFIHMHGFSQ